MDPKIKPFLPITVQQAKLWPQSPKPTTASSAVKTSSSHYQSANVNQQIIHRPISQIIHK